MTQTEHLFAQIGAVYRRPERTPDDDAHLTIQHFRHPSSTIRRRTTPVGAPR
jgi:hypothetical protein